MGRELRLEARSLQPQLREAGRHGLGEAREVTRALAGELLGCLGRGRPGALLLLLECPAVGALLLEPGALVAQGIAALGEAGGFHPVLASEPLEQGQLLLEVLEARGVGLGSVEGRPQESRGCLQLRRRLAHAGPGLLEGGDARDPRLQLALGALHDL